MTAKAGFVFKRRCSKGVWFGVTVVEGRRLRVELINKPF